MKVISEAPMPTAATHSQIRADRVGAASVADGAWAGFAGTGTDCADFNWACPCTSKVMRKLNPPDEELAEP